MKIYVSSNYLLFKLDGYDDKNYFYFVGYISNIGDMCRSYEHMFFGNKLV